VRRVVAVTVASELERAGQTTLWLAERSGIAHPALQKKLAMKVDFTVADLADIAAVLDIAVTRLTPTSDER
jgi:hypothetical protein